jgi:hypothetical protein
MIGEQIESRPSFPVGALIFFLIAVALMVLALVVQNIHPAVGAVLPLCITSALLWNRTPPFAGVFTEEALEVSYPGTATIPYDSLQGLWGKGRSSDPTKPGRRSFAISIAHADGTLEIPARLNVPSDDVYLFLYERFPPEGARGVSPLLQEYLEEQEKAFGPERVFCYRARAHMGRTSTYRRARAVSLAFVAAGVLWCVMPAFLPKGQGIGWLVAGITVVIFGLLFFVAFLAESRRSVGGGRIKNWRKSSLVISPVGLALVQGDVKGEMRWDELRDLKMRSVHKSFEFHSTDFFPGITLVFEGATVTIADIYDQPQRIIFERIRAYWK